MTPTRLAVLALVATIPFAASSARSAAQTGVAAAWVPKHVRFIYRGQRTRYSCDALRNEIFDLLSKMGARDLEVNETPCPRSMGGPVPFPGVDVNMQVIAPAAAAKGSNAALVGAHWQEVILSGRTVIPLYYQPSRALVQQFKDTFLPLFTTRNIQYWPTGAPPHLSAEVLLPERKR